MSQPAVAATPPFSRPSEPSAEPSEPSPISDARDPGRKAPRAPPTTRKTPQWVAVTVAVVVAPHPRSLGAMVRTLGTVVAWCRIAFLIWRNQGGDQVPGRVVRDEGRSPKSRKVNGEGGDEIQEMVGSMDYLCSY